MILLALALAAAGPVSIESVVTDQLFKSAAANRWLACAVEGAKIYARTGEPAETIVRAVMITCEDEERAARLEAARLWNGIDTAAEADSIAKLGLAVRERALAAAVHRKAGLILESK